MTYIPPLSLVTTSSTRNRFAGAPPAARPPQQIRFPREEDTLQISGRSRQVENAVQGKGLPRFAGRFFNRAERPSAPLPATTLAEQAITPRQLRSSPFTLSSNTRLYEAAKYDWTPGQRTSVEQECLGIIRSGGTDTPIARRVEALKAFCEIQLAHINIKPGASKAAHDSLRGQLARALDNVLGKGKQKALDYRLDPNRPELEQATKNLRELRFELQSGPQSPEVSQLRQVLTSYIDRAKSRLNEADVRNLNSPKLTVPNMEQIYQHLLDAGADRAAMDFRAASRQFDDIGYQGLKDNPEASGRMSSGTLDAHQDEKTVGSVFARYPGVHVPSRDPSPYLAHPKAVRVLDAIKKLGPRELQDTGWVKVDAAPGALVERNVAGMQGLDRSTQIGRKFAKAVNNLSRHAGRDDMNISVAMSAQEFTAEQLPHMLDMAAAPGSKLHEFILRGTGHVGQRQEERLAEVLGADAQPLRRIDLGRIGLRGDPVLAALRSEGGRRLESLFMPDSRVSAGALAEALESPGELKQLGVGLSPIDIRGAQRLAEAMGRENLPRRQELALNLHGMALDGAIQTTLGDGLRHYLSQASSPGTFSIRHLPADDLGLSRRIADGLTRQSSGTRKLEIATRGRTYDVQPWVDALNQPNFAVKDLKISHPAIRQVTRGMSSADQLRLIEAAASSGLERLDLKDCPAMTEAHYLQAQALLGANHRGGGQLRVYTSTPAHLRAQA